ncbi:MAG: hypothetical protein ACO1RA_06515 [Planctomycetaceae bacterium]
MGCDVEAVIDAAQVLRRTAFVLDAGKGDVVLYDEACDSQDIDEIQSLGVALSQKLPGPILASLNHDDDHLLLWIFFQGNCMDHYESWWDALRFTESLCKWCGSSWKYPQLLFVLGMPTFIFEISRHMRVSALLGIPVGAMTTGYTYLQRGELPMGFSSQELRRV